MRRNQVCATAPGTVWQRKGIDVGDQRMSDEANDDAARTYASQLDEQIADSHDYASDAEGAKDELHR